MIEVIFFKLINHLLTQMGDFDSCYCNYPPGTFMLLLTAFCVLFQVVISWTQSLLKIYYNVNRAAQVSPWLLFLFVVTFKQGS